MGVETSQLEKIPAVAKSYGVTRLILFGSAAITPETARDIDLACDGITGWDLYALGAQLEEAIDLPIDLIPLSPINSFTKAIEAQYIRQREAQLHTLFGKLKVKRAYYLCQGHQGIFPLDEKLGLRPNELSAEC